MKKTASPLRIVSAAMLGLLLASCTTFERKDSQAPYVADVAETFSEAYAEMKPIDRARGNHPKVDAEGLRGKSFTGYQGWFMAKGDGGAVGWMHYGSSGKKGSKDRNFAPGNVVTDLWHSVKDAGPTEKYPTPFTHEDGSIAHTISSLHPDTVDRHYQWMSEYGIDGAFLQRFGVSLKRPEMYDCRNIVLDNVRHAARRHGRTYAVMYDLSGLRKGEIRSVVMEDWKRLSRQMKVVDEANYMTLNGKPLVSIWGIGFGDGTRQYSVEECSELIDFLKNDPEFGGCSVMLGVPFYWREGIKDSVSIEELHPVIEKADVISPWAVGRSKTIADARAKAAIYEGDYAWCNDREIEYLPVAYPGFSWGNLSKSRGKKVIYDHIPRLEGAFLWSQAETIADAGIETIYLAMFDEIDEGTSFLKVSQNPPVGASRFLHYEGVEDDYYLWLAGRVRDLLKGKISSGSGIPIRETATN